MTINEDNPQTPKPLTPVEALDDLPTSYTLNCDGCGKPFQSKSSMLSPQLCYECANKVLWTRDNTHLLGPVVLVPSGTTNWQWPAKLGDPNLCRICGLPGNFVKDSKRPDAHTHSKCYRRTYLRRSLWCKLGLHRWRLKHKEKDGSMKWYWKCVREHCTARVP